jgi:hypothetical protein
MLAGFQPVPADQGIPGHGGGGDDIRLAHGRGKIAGDTDLDLRQIEIARQRLRPGRAAVPDQHAPDGPDGGMGRDEMRGHGAGTHHQQG